MNGQVCPDSVKQSQDKKVVYQNLIEVTCVVI